MLINVLEVLSGGGEEGEEEGNEKEREERGGEGRGKEGKGRGKKDNHYISWVKQVLSSTIPGVITFPIQTLLQILPFLKTSCILTFFSPSQTALISYSHMIFSRRLFWPQLNNLFQTLYILKYSLEETETHSVPTPGKTALNHEVGVSF